MARTIVRRVSVPTVLAFLLAGGLASVAFAVDAVWDSTCSSGDVCNYRDSYRGGLLAATTSSDPDYTSGSDFYSGTGTGINDTVTSVWNRKSSNDVIWCPNANYGNNAFGNVCMNPGTYSNDVGWQFNDTFSSHLIAAGSAC